jgi:hypothetical protein
MCCRLCKSFYFIGTLDILYNLRYSKTHFNRIYGPVFPRSERGPVTAEFNGGRRARCLDGHKDCDYARSSFLGNVFRESRHL